MREKWLWLVAAGAVWIAGSANAVPVAHVSSLTLTVVIQNLGTISIGGTGTIIVDKTAGTLFVPAALSLTTTLNLPVTTTTSVVSVIGKPGLDQLSATFGLGQVTVTMSGEICGGGNTAVAPGGTSVEACVVGGGLNGAMALSGTISVNLGGGFTIPIFLGPALIGQGGTAVVPPVTGFFFENGKWTTHTAAVNLAHTTSTTTTILFVGTTFTMMFTGIPTTEMETRMGTGTLSELTNGSGQVTLVTPTYVLALGNRLPIFSSFTIHVIPEPGTLLLLGSGVLGLAFYSRRRAKK